jgi:hypothetical protein
MALDRRPVDDDHAVNHLEAVPRQPDHPLDEIVGSVAKHHDIAALRLAGQDAAGKQRRRKWKRVAAEAVAEFRDEQIVPDQQRRLHRAGGDIERLNQEAADDERDEERLEDRDYRLGETAIGASLLYL